MGFAPGDAIAFGESTHQLVYRLLSTLDLSSKPRVVTTTSEFHSLHRQLSRLSEDGLEVTWVDASERARLSERLLAAIKPGTAVVALSAVLFEDAYVVDRLDEIIARGQEVGALVLIDAYHAFNVVELSFGADRSNLFVTAGGYKYAGFGNGICWLRIPANCSLRPAYTGWFADFASLAKPRDVTGQVAYGEAGARFAGATFDASALYRARAVLAHWARFGLGVAELRGISKRQTARLITRLDEAPGAPPLVSSRDPGRRAGFVTLRVPQAGQIVTALRRRGVWVDARGDLLRLGPAPYLLDDELDRGVAILIEILQARS
jgi:selenocysteine lyase/cysteine desulfurase